MTDVDDGTDQMRATIGFLGTGEGTIEVILGHSPSYYRLQADREDFEEQLLVLVNAWKAAQPVLAHLRGTTILSVEPG